MEGIERIEVFSACMESAPGIKKASWAAGWWGFEVLVRLMCQPNSTDAREPAPARMASDSRFRAIEEKFMGASVA